MFTIRLAGTGIEIINHYLYIEELCRPFYWSGRPGLQVEATAAEVAAMQVSQQIATPGYAESSCLLRKITDGLLSRETLLLHAVAVERDGKGYIFTGPSGIGKSTHARMWQQAFPGTVIINGDKPLIRRLGAGRYIVCGSPWQGKENQGTNLSVPLQGICFLEQGKEDRIRPVPADEIQERLLRQLLLPKEAGELDQFLALVDHVSHEIRFHVLSCTISPQAAQLARAAMEKNI